MIRLKRTAKYIKKVDYDKDTGEILTASSILDIDEDLIREEEALDGYYMLLTSEMDTPDDKIIDMYRGLWRIEESFKITKSELWIFLCGRAACPV